MKFFDLELGGLGAATVTHDGNQSNKNCWIVTYTNGSTSEQCNGTGSGQESVYCTGLNPECAKNSVSQVNRAIGRIRR